MADEAQGLGTEALGAAADGDLVLLLGAQGMDAGRQVALRWLRDRGMAS